MGEVQELLDFFKFFYEGQSGYVYLGFKLPGTKIWRKEYYEWPKEKEKLVTKVLTETAKYEVYFGPALFKTKSSLKEDFKGSYVYWVDFDDGIPKSENGISRPSLRVRSSLSSREHWYWKSEEFITDINRVERANEFLTDTLGGDPVCWNANHVLRPPFTNNHYRKSKVSIVERDGQAFVGAGAFEAFLAEHKELTTLTEWNNLPALSEVLLKYKFPAEVLQFFKKQLPDGMRAKAMVNLAYSFAEMQLRDEEIYVLLLDVDNRWGKFLGRSDREYRIKQIVAKARTKYPLTEPADEDTLRGYGFQSLLATSIELEWIWQDYLQEQGYMLLAGLGGVGKTQLSLDFAAHVALGQEFLGKQIYGRHKVGFLSLEMGHADLKWFISHQAKGFTGQELEQLEENLKLFPVGEPVYLNQTSNQDRLEEIIFENKLKGIVVDSVGSMSDSDLVQLGDVKPIVDWIDRMRQRHKCFVWLIHHTRKATSDNKKPTKLSDIYGNAYLVNRATTVFCLWGGKNPNAIETIPLKVRLAARPDPFLVYRNAKLQFTLKQAGLTVTSTKKSTPKDTSLSSLSVGEATIKVPGII